MTYTYTYDAANQLTAIQIPGTGSITYSSYTWNRPASITLPGGSKKDYVYDPLMRIKQITAKDPAQNLLMNYQYTYDKMDNIKTKGTEHGDYQYGYDDLYRLTSADNPVQNDEAYTYDSVGNRLTSEGVGGTWSYNQNNELQNYNGLTFSYDQNGSTIQKNDNGTITNYIYNTEDRLTEVRDGSNGLIASYYYDPFGRRLWKDVGGARTYFLYADEGLIGEYDSSGIELKAYGYKPNAIFTTDPLFMKVGNEYYFYHNDHLGTPQKIATANGAVAWSATYTSFGEALIDASATITNNLRFPGQYFDEETGLHYNYFRYYDPKTGRYLTSDPIGLVGGINLFLYCANNPVNYLDVLGLKSKECCYEYDWKCKKCIKWGPKKLDADCFLSCMAKNFAEYTIGGIAAYIMVRLSHPVLGGILIAAGLHHIYAVCYLPCIKCPFARLVNFEPSWPKPMFLPRLQDQEDYG